MLKNFDIVLCDESDGFIGMICMCSMIDLMDVIFRVCRYIVVLKLEVSLCFSDYVRIDVWWWDWWEEC